MAKVNSTTTPHIPTDNNVQADKTKPSSTTRQHSLKEAATIKAKGTKLQGGILGPILNKLFKQKSAPPDQISDQRLKPLSYYYFQNASLIDAKIKKLKKSAAPHEKKIDKLEKQLESKKLSPKNKENVNKKIENLKKVVENKKDEINLLEKLVIESKLKKIGQQTTEYQNNINELKKLREGELSSRDKELADKEIDRLTTRMEANNNEAYPLKNIAINAKIKEIKQQITECENARDVAIDVLEKRSKSEKLSSRDKERADKEIDKLKTVVKMKKNELTSCKYLSLMIKIEKIEQETAVYKNRIDELEEQRKSGKLSSRNKKLADKEIDRLTAIVEANKNLVEVNENEIKALEKSKH